MGELFVPMDNKTNFVLLLANIRDDSEKKKNEFNHSYYTNRWMRASTEKWFMLGISWSRYKQLYVRYQIVIGDTGDRHVKLQICIMILAAPVKTVEIPYKCRHLWSAPPITSHRMFVIFLGCLELAACPVHVLVLRTHTQCYSCEHKRRVERTLTHWQRMVLDRLWAFGYVFVCVRLSIQIREKYEENNTHGLLVARFGHTSSDCVCTYVCGMWSNSCAAIAVASGSLAESMLKRRQAREFSLKYRQCTRMGIERNVTNARGNRKSVWISTKTNGHQLWYDSYIHQLFRQPNGHNVRCLIPIGIETTVDWLNIDMGNDSLRRHLVRSAWKRFWFRIDVCCSKNAYVRHIFFSNRFGWDKSIVKLQLEFS